MGVGPFPAKSFTLKSVSMKLQKAGDVIRRKKPLTTIVLGFVNGRGVKGIGAEKAMSVPSRGVERNLVTSMITHQVDDRNNFSSEL
tara:strand:+ start:388 stop:645 length:258 start_codon:yes stop_codon:yes gene_type:complete